MVRISVDETAPAVRKFLGRLPFQGAGIELELDGKVICRIFPASPASEEDKTALAQRGLEIARKARDRNKGVPARVIDKEIDDAVAQVRKRRKK
jgi:hypothetical protein